MQPKRAAWRRLLGEAAVVIVSVYVAIVLEGMSGDRSRVSEATDGLAQLRDELRKDQGDLEVVTDQQEDQEIRYADLRRWFAAPSSMPLDSVGQTLDSVAYHSRTLFPRNSAWTMMVAGGQLSFVADRALVTRLGDHYENANERHETLSARYDDTFLRLTEETFLSLWDFENARLLSTDPMSITIFRNELRSVASFNQYYRDFLSTYSESMEALIVDIERYLQASGRDRN